MNDKRLHFKENLKELLEEDETMAIGNPDELIYQIDDLKVFGGYMDGMRGVDHNVLKFDDVEWEEIMTWGTLVVPEHQVYYSDTEIAEFESFGMQRQPLLENHKVNLNNSNLQTSIKNKDKQLSSEETAAFSSENSEETPLKVSIDISRAQKLSSTKKILNQDIER